MFFVLIFLHVSFSKQFFKKWEGLVGGGGGCWGAQARMGRKDSGVGDGWGKSERGEMEGKKMSRRKKRKKQRLSYKTNSRSPASGGCYVRVCILLQLRALHTLHTLHALHTLHPLHTLSVPPQWRGLTIYKYIYIFIYMYI